MKSSPGFIREYVKRLPLRLLILLTLFIGVLLLFVYIAHEVLLEKEEALDEAVFYILSIHVINDGLTSFMKAVTYFASSAFLQIAYALLAGLYLFKRNWKRALEIAIIGLGGYLINYVMKLSFQRVRPPGPLIERLENFSFPSGHATSAFIFYGLLTYLIWKTEIPKLYKYVAGGLLLFFSVLIGFSRVYLRVHYTSDVLAGFCIGFAWLLFTIGVFENLKKKLDRENKFEKEPSGMTTVDNSQ